MLLVSLSIINFGNIETNKIYTLANNIDNNYPINNEIVDSTKRNYNYINYKNNTNYNIKNKDDIKNAIYNGLNDGKNTITLYCKYRDNDECLNDFYSIYKNKSLMSSINNYVNPYNMYSSIRYRININNGHIKINLDITKKYTEEEIKEINKTIDNYLNNLNINEMTDSEKIKWAHDFIVDRNKYDEEAIQIGSGSAYNAYGAIVNNKAICRGYAEAMAIILDKLNIPNIMISSGIHIWNLVNLDGSWLHLDTTWDDPIYTSGKEAKIYDYYLITTEELAKLDNSNSHTFNSNYYIETTI